MLDVVLGLYICTFVNNLYLYTLYLYKYKSQATYEREPICPNYSLFNMVSD